MQKLIYWVAFLLPVLAFSQNKFNYTVSQPYPVIDAGIKTYFSIEGKDKILAVKIDGKDFHIQSFDTKSMKEIKRSKFNDMPKGFRMENLTWLGNSVYYFFSLWDKANETEQLFVREIDFDNCQFKGESRRIIAVKGKLTNGFSFLFSYDKSRLLVQSRRKPEKVRDDQSYDKILMHVFDENLTNVAENEIKMPYTEKQMDNVDYSVDSEGNAYILAKVRLDGSSKNVVGRGDNKTINYHIELLKINVKKATINISKIDVADNYITNIWLFEGIDNTMLCSGFYNKNASSNADGIFLFRVTKEGEIENKKFYEIPLEILNQYISERAQNKNAKKDEKGKAEITNLTLRKLVVQDDNSILIMGEKYYIVAHQSKNGTYYTYHYEEILVTKINADGSLGWMRKLPKRQMGTRGLGGMSFDHMTIDGNHYFVFMDNIKNMELSLDKFPDLHRDGMGGFLTAYCLNNETGKPDKISILDTKKIAEGYSLYQFDIGRILYVSKDEFVIEFYIKQKQDVMIKVKVK